MRHPKRRWSAVALTAALAIACAFGSRVGAAHGSVVIWPINPAIPDGARGTALWLENRGRSELTLQIRVLRWVQVDHVNRYEDASDSVVASPPFATIAPGKRQLVRLMRLRGTPDHSEEAYRVLIDEIPSPASAATRSATAAQPTMGVTFRMRYSLPLFLYGRGLQPGESRTAADTSAGRPVLTWRVATHAGKRYLYVRNDGNVHARLGRLRRIAPGVTADLVPGLLGYVLAGSEMRWPVPDDDDLHDASLEAVINGRPVELRHAGHPRTGS